jgi:hypothetical protein
VAQNPSDQIYIAAKPFVKALHQDVQKGEAFVTAIFMQLLRLSKQETHDMIMASMCGSMQCGPPVVFSMSKYFRIAREQHADDTDIGLTTCVS